jgi:hypothetical protein
MEMPALDFPTRHAFPVVASTLLSTPCANSFSCVYAQLVSRSMFNMLAWCITLDRQEWATYKTVKTGHMIIQTSGLINAVMCQQQAVY